jgi:hypothetical protein
MVQDALDTHMDGTQQHGAGSGRYLATTNRADQRAAYADLVGVPSTFAPAAHKTSHATGGSDALTPADIGAAPATRQIGTNGGLTGGGDLSADRTLSIADGGVTDTKIGNRTISDAAAPTGDTGTIATLLGWLANMIKSITGKANWRTAPATSLEAAANHINSTQGAHAGTAISNVPAGNISANSVQAAINELDTEKAGKDLANTFTQRQTFAAGTQDGDGNQDVSYLMSLQVPIDTRSWVFTAWSPAGRPTHGEIRVGTTVVCTIDITYDASSGNPTQAVFVAGGKTITCTIGWDAQGRCTGWNRAVS